MDRSCLYSVALKCAELHDKGCAMGCAQCQFNVFNYGLKINEASLLKANAYTDYETAKDNKLKWEAAAMAPLMLMVILCGLVLWTCSSVKSCMQPKPADLISDIETDPDVLFIRDHVNDISAIYSVFRVMKKYGVPDLNNDGKVDCIDHSVWFRSLYGSKAHLIINRNPKTGMNHMFIRINYGLFEFVDVEPQGDEFKHSMGLIWGMKYDPFYNEDVTYIWSNYTRH